MRDVPRNLPHSKACRRCGPRASQAAGSPPLSREVVSHEQGSVTRDPRANPCLGTDFGRLSPQASWSRGCL